MDRASASCAVDSGFNSDLDQTTDLKIIIYCRQLDYFCLKFSFKGVMYRTSSQLLLCQISSSLAGNS